MSPTKVSPYMFRADLHCHSTCSDGSLTPAELVKLAAEIGLQGLSITDHDTTEAYPSVIEEGKKLNVTVIPGVEFSCVHNNHSVHILAYAYALGDTPLQGLCQRHSLRRAKRNSAILQRLREDGMEISEADLEEQATSKKVVGRPHIAKALLAKGYVTSLQDAFKRYIGEGQQCYVQGEQITVEETIEIIHASKGLAIIAHPHLVHEKGLIQELLGLPFDGMECYYGRYPANAHDRWLQLAKKKGWLATGGSDFHGAAKPTIPLGISWTPEETFKVLYNHYSSH